MSGKISRRSAIGQGALLAASAAAVPAFLHSGEAKASSANWSTRVREDRLRIGAENFVFSREDRAPRHFHLRVAVTNSRNEVLKTYELDAYEMETNPEVEVTISHYVDGQLRAEETAAWNREKMVSSSWNEGSYDSVGVHNWMISDGGWAGERGTPVITFSPIGQSSSSC